MRWFWQTQADLPVSELGYADPSHAQFNAMLEAKRTLEPPSIDLSAPWMTPETLAKLPQLNTNFEQSRNIDAMQGAQDRHKTTQQQTGSGSSDRKQDAPKPELKPKGALRKRADQAAKDEMWLAALRDEVMEQAIPDQERMPPQPHHRMEIDMK